MIKVEISSMHVFTRSCKILNETDRTQKYNQRIHFFVHQSAYKRDREIIKSPRRINTGMKCEEILIMVRVLRNSINKILVYELKRR